MSIPLCLYRFVEHSLIFPAGRTIISLIDPLGRLVHETRQPRLYICLGHCYANAINSKTKNPDPTFPTAILTRESNINN